MVVINAVWENVVIPKRWRDVHDFCSNETTLEANQNYWRGFTYKYNLALIRTCRLNLDLNTNLRKLSVCYTKCNEFAHQSDLIKISQRDVAEFVCPNKLTKGGLMKIRQVGSFFLAFLNENTYRIVIS